MRPDAETSPELALPDSFTIAATEFHREEVETAMARFAASSNRLPPMYSAKKMGRKLYELARRGEEVERKSVQITVREFEVIQGEGPG